MHGALQNMISTVALRFPLLLLLLVLLSPLAYSFRMGWDDIKLNDGTTIPSIAFGTWTLGNGQQSTDKVDQALSVGFNHIDTAQAYRNEAEAGVALRDSGLKREELYITTKFSGLGGLDIETSITNSLQNLGIGYVDLYLIHSPRLAPDIAAAWAKMEKLQSEGKAKSIGVSNFEISHLETLLATAKVKPVANQILFHPYVYARQAPLVAWMAQHGIVAEAYSVLIPITRQPGGPVDKLVTKIGKRLNAAPEQVLLAWAKAKGVVVVTSSTKKERLEGYLDAGDLKLTDEDIVAIDAAGASGSRRLSVRTFVQRTVVVALFGAAALRVCGYFGINIL